MLPQISPSLSAMTPIPTGGQAPSPAPNVRAPLYSLHDKGDDLLVVVEIPGADPHKIDLEVNATTLTIHASLSERLKRDRLGSYRGSLNLPEPVEPEQATADYVEGLLEVVLPKTRSLKKHKVKIAYSEVGQHRSPREKADKDPDEK
jgi:HSP20 family molecular chaperone IbpA